MTEILITGATDGIGRSAAELLAGAGHTLLLHGRNGEKLAAVAAACAPAPVECFTADFSMMAEVAALATRLAERGAPEVIVNNAGILKASPETTADGLDIRIAVNTLAPYLLTRHLRPHMPEGGRVVNVSSTAQAPVEMEAVGSPASRPAMAAYAQSKLAILMWGRHVSEQPGAAIIGVNPGSLLGYKMVRDGFGVAGGDLSVGAQILAEAATGARFESANGQYFDNDAGRFGRPHQDALDPGKCARLTTALDDILSRLGVA
ncbi:MAG: SDR family NAD(P)-dependent oxidoreductase [Pseudomonadota bacterium]